jgi:hypothetical protein
VIFWIVLALFLAVASVSLVRQWREWRALDDGN